MRKALLHSCFYVSVFRAHHCEAHHFITVKSKNMKNKEVCYITAWECKRLEAQLCPLPAVLLGNVINLPEPQFLSLEMVVIILPCRPVVKIVLRIDET